MELEQIRTFARVVEQRSFTKASSTLHLSQPAVTRQVAALEADLGARLLERRVRQVTPTAAGAALHAYALRILGLEQDCRAAVTAVEQGVSGHLRVAASGTAATYLLPDVLGRFRARHSAIDITVHTSSSDEAARMAVEDRVDAAVVMDFRGHPELNQVRAGRYALMAAMNADHRLAAQRSVSIEQLAAEPLIAMLPGANLRRLVDSLFHSHGAAPHVAAEVDHLEAMKKMAAARVGLAIVPDLAVNAARDGLKVVPIREASRHHHWSVLFRKGRAETVIIRFFLDCVKHPKPRA